MASRRAVLGARQLGSLGISAYAVGILRIPCVTHEIGGDGPVVEYAADHCLRLEAAARGAVTVRV